jgi:methyl-accepting chemotaxis protein
MESRTQQRQQQHATNLADIMVQGAARIVELQTSTARVLLRAQGRGAAMFGAPDWTELLGRSGPDHLSELFVSGAQQALNLMRHTNETLNLVQQQVGHLVEQQTAQVAEQMRQGVEEVSRRTEQTLDQLRNTTQEAMSEAERASEESGESARRGASTRSRRRG